jgi:hypothetical protein
MASKVKRLPYHRAPFYFGPEYLATSGQWQSSFNRMVQGVLRRERIDAAVAADGAYGLAVVFGRVKFNIDALGGTFWLNDVEDRIEGRFLHSPPEIFTRCALNPPLKLRPIVGDGNVVASLAESLIIEMEINFEEALRAGWARIEAKVNSRTAAFTALDPQDRHHVRIRDSLRDALDDEDNDLDDACYDTGEDLYSFGVVPVVNEKSETVAKARGGRPLTYDKETLGRELDALMDYHGDFTPADPDWNAQARLAEEAIEICKNRFGSDLAFATAKLEAKAAAERYRNRRSAKN